MPELPEVETIRRDLDQRLAGRRVVSVDILSPKTALPSAAFFIKHLSGRTIVGLDRRGKLLIVRLFPLKGKRSPLGVASYLLIHLKMTGQLIYIDAERKIAGGHSLSATRLGESAWQSAVGGELPGKHTRAILSLSGGARLYFNDLRKFGYLKLVSSQELDRLIHVNYGPEPLMPDFTPTALSAALSGKKVSVKALLLDQKRIAGLGNIYVDEVLYAARINPRRLAGSLRPREIGKLHSAINRIIGLAIKHRGTTFSDYVDSSGTRGNFSRFLKVYGRQGGRCGICRGPITKIKLAGRGTHYCPSCQS